MSKNITSLLSVALISSLSLMVSCKDSQKAKKTHSVAEASKLEKEGKHTEASDMYARIGEILLSQPEGITHAQTMFNKSLELNAHNNKANLYSALLSPQMKAQGFMTRYKNIADLSALEAKIRKSDKKEIIDFAFIMPKDVKAATKMDDLRKFFRNEYATEIGKSLVKLDNIKSEKFAIDLNVAAYKKARPDMTVSGYGTPSCIITDAGVSECSEASYETFNVAASPRKTTYKSSLDKYDIKAIKILLKTQKNALVLANSIGLDGYEAVNDQINVGAIRTDKAIVAAIQQHPNLLKIDGSKDDLNKLFNNTEEVMNDLMDFSKLSKELCSPENRQDNVFQSICVTDEVADKINEALMFVVGPKSVVLGKDVNGDEVLLEVDLRALIRSKVTSLQELLPNKFDASGKAIDVKDLTFAGVIPNADLISKYKTVVSK